MVLVETFLRETFQSVIWQTFFILIEPLTTYFCICVYYLYSIAYTAPEVERRRLYYVIKVNIEEGKKVTEVYKCKEGAVVGG